MQPSNRFYKTIEIRLPFLTERSLTQMSRMLTVICSFVGVDIHPTDVVEERRILVVLTALKLE